MIVESHGVQRLMIGIGRVRIILTIQSSVVQFRSSFSGSLLCSSVSRRVEQNSHSLSIETLH